MTHLLNQIWLDNYNLAIKLCNWELVLLTGLGLQGKVVNSTYSADPTKASVDEANLPDDTGNVELAC